MIELLIKWEQDDTNIFINLEVNPEEQVSVEFSINKVQVSIEGKVVLYEELYSTVKDLECSYSRSGSTMIISLIKDKAESWPFLWAKQMVTIDDIETDQVDESDINSIILIKYPFDTPKEIVWRTVGSTFVGPYLTTERCSPSSKLSFVIKYGDDALVYSLTSNTLSHIATFDAMTFVQSSKQDRRYVIFLPNHSIIIESSRHVFIYERLVDRRARHARQFLINLDSGQSIIGWSILARNTLVLLTRIACHVIRLPE
jgi:hypothetical protein